MKVTIVCAQCSRSFEVFPCNKSRKYCSAECRNIAYKGVTKVSPNRQCKQCGAAFYASPSRSTAYCSSICYHASTAGKPAHNKGTGKGYVITDRGYKKIKLPDHPRADKRGYVREHIVVMEQIIGRHLAPGETVHHKNKVRDDNRPENLELFSSHSDHLKQDFPKGKPVASRWSKTKAS